jgi:hypothetical protein
MTPQAQITSTGGTDFYRQVAVFAYASYINEGRGTVVIQKSAFITLHDGRIEAHLQYIRQGESSEFVPSKVSEQINLYNPEKECVLTMIDEKGEAAVITLSSDRIGMTPRKAFEEEITKD